MQKQDDTIYFFPSVNGNIPVQLYKGSNVTDLEGSVKITLHSLTRKFSIIN